MPTRYIELLGELKAELRHLYDDHRDQEKAITMILQDISALKTAEVSGLKRRASLWGGSMGAVVAAVVAVVKYVFNQAI